MASSENPVICLSCCEISAVRSGSFSYEGSSKSEKFSFDAREQLRRTSCGLSESVSPWLLVSVWSAMSDWLFPSDPTPESSSETDPDPILFIFRAEWTPESESGMLSLSIFDITKISGRLSVSSSCFFKKQHILCRQPTILLLSFVAVVLIKLSEFIFHFRLLSSVTSGMFHSWNFEANTFVECFGYIFLLVGSLLSLNQAGCEEGYFKFWSQFGKFFNNFVVFIKFRKKS